MMSRLAFSAILISVLAFSSPAWAPKTDGKEEMDTSDDTSATRAKPRAGAVRDPILYVIENQFKPGVQAQLVISHFCGKQAGSETTISKTTLKPIPFPSGKATIVRRSHLPKAADFLSEAIEINLWTSTGDLFSHSEDSIALKGENVIDPTAVDPLGLFKADLPQNTWKILPGSRGMLSPLYE